MENCTGIMNEGIEAVTEEVVVDNVTGIGTGKVVLIGAGLTLALGAGIMLAKKLYNAHKAKKELRKPDKEVIIDADDFEDEETA